MSLSIWLKASFCQALQSPAISSNFPDQASHPKGGSQQVACLTLFLPFLLSLDELLLILLLRLIIDSESKEKPIQLAAADLTAFLSLQAFNVRRDFSFFLTLFSLSQQLVWGSISGIS